MPIILIFILFLSGCSVQKADSKTLQVDIGSEPPTLDPAMAEDAHSYRVVNDLFAGLIDFDQTNKPIAGMANKWDISSDGKKYIFYLRKNLKFSNGKQITAKDFVYSWQRLVDPKTASPYSFLLKDIVNAQEIKNSKKPASSLGVQAIDNYTLVVNLDQANNNFLIYLTVPNTFVIDRQVVEKYNKEWTKPENIVTSGAYSLKQHIINGYIFAQKNSYYYDANNVAITNIKYYPYKDTNVSLANYKTNNLDTTWQNVPIDKYVMLKNQYGKELHLAQWERIEFLNFNMRLAKYAQNKKLRQALNIAIDRDVLVNQVLKSGQLPLNSVVSPTIEDGNYKNIKFSWTDKNRDQQITLAKKLYKEAGYSSKHPLTITLKYKTNDLYKKMALSVAAMWHETLGINVVLQNQEWKSLINSLHQGDFDIAQGGWGADYNSVTTYTQLYICNSGNNHAGYCSLGYDKLVNEAEYTKDKDKQHELYDKAFKIVLEDHPIIPLFEPSHQRLINPRVQGYIMETNYLDNVQTKWMHLVP